jgi:hypothetical protein
MPVGADYSSVLVSAVDEIFGTRKVSGPPPASSCQVAARAYRCTVCSPQPRCRAISLSPRPWAISSCTLAWCCLARPASFPARSGDAPPGRRGRCGLWPDGESGQAGAEPHAGHGQE